MTQLYAGPIVDPHHHLWDLGLDRHPWLAPSPSEFGGLGDLAPLRRNYLPEDYLRDAARHEIVATVHVEAGWLADDCLGETRWLDSIAKPGNVAQRYVARVPLASAEAPSLIEAQAAFSRVVGVRDILSWSEDPARRFAARGDLMDDATWRSNLRLLSRRELVFDLMVYPGQLGDAARLARDLPDQPFVLEHGGSPIDRDREGIRRWREGLAAVSRSPNVAIKISDLVAYDRQWTLDSLREIVLHCIDCFGPERAMFASDFPVAGLYATFDEAYGAFKTIVSGFSQRDQSAMFFDNAKRIYRIDGASAP
jgi:predicted TIM-barrel fold metal-dependent hydrolase